MRLTPATAAEDPLPLELEEALEQHRPVLMVYLDARQKRTERTINPIEIRRSGEEMVLIAHCHLRGDRRNFKVERIVELRRTEDTPAATAPPQIQLPLSTPR
jgi:predicted DNA-binding transcriptional regulator YafY